MRNADERGVASVRRQIQAAGGRHSCPPGLAPAALRSDSDCRAYAWFRATHKGADHRFQDGPAKSQVPVHTGSGDDPTAVRLSIHPLENTAAHCMFRRVIQKGLDLCFALLLPYSPALQRRLEDSSLGRNEAGAAIPIKKLPCEVLFWELISRKSVRELPRCFRPCLKPIPR